MTNKAVSTSLAQFELSANVKMEDVVSAFVTDWEDRMREDIKSRQAIVKQLGRELEAFEEEARAAVNTSQFETTVKVLDITCTVKRTSIDWNSGVADVEIELKDNQATKRSYRDSIGFERQVPVPKVTLKKHEKLAEELATEREGLSRQMSELHDLPRKERQVRGRIAKMKLAESGASDLLKDKELMKLVQL